MKIVFSGGGTGGHFYPLIAVAEAVNQIAAEKKLVQPRLYYLADQPYDRRALFENNVQFSVVNAGKLRRYPSWRNWLDWLKTGAGFLTALFKLFLIYPQVIFSKGGYASFPILAAARLLKIPVVIHESDSKPGRVNLWAAKFARRIAISYPESANLFPKEKTILTGIPLRQNLTHPISQGAFEFLKLEEGIPTIYVTGGSQGAKTINEVLVDALPSLVENYQIVHQTGAAGFNENDARARLLLESSPFKNRYKSFPFLNETALRMIAGAADLIISRAGSTTLYEIAAWKKPSVIIPLPEEISHDQRSNAFTFARYGGAVVIEQANLTSSILSAEINRLLKDKDALIQMGEAAYRFFRPQAARAVAETLIGIALENE